MVCIYHAHSGLYDFIEILMASSPFSEYQLCWLNKDGFAYSPLKAEEDAECWLDYGSYIIPANFVWGL